MRLPISFKKALAFLGIVSLFVMGIAAPSFGTGGIDEPAPTEERGPANLDAPTEKEKPKATPQPTPSPKPPEKPN